MWFNQWATLLVDRVLLIHLEKFITKSAVCFLPFLKNFLTHVSGRSKLRMAVGRSSKPVDRLKFLYVLLLFIIVCFLPFRFLLVPCLESCVIVDNALYQAQSRHFTRARQDSAVP